MAQQLIDITGNVYNYLQVIGFSHMGGRRRSYWKCKCLLCGNEITLRKDAFVYDSSHNKSCGCWHRIESSRRKKDEKTGRFVGVS